MAISPTASPVRRDEDGGPQVGAMPDGWTQADGGSARSGQLSRELGGGDVFCLAAPVCSAPAPSFIPTTPSPGRNHHPPFSEEEVGALEAQVPDPSALWAESQSPQPRVGSRRPEPVSGSLRSELGNSGFWKAFSGDFLLHLALTPSGRLEKCNGIPGHRKQVQMPVTRTSNVG